MKSVKKILISPNGEQRNQIDFWIRRCRYLYNTALEEKQEYYRHKKKSLNLYEQKKELVEIKNWDSSWKEVPNKALADVIFRLDKSYQNFFKNPKCGFPKYKNSNNYKSVYFVADDVRIKNGYLFLPKMKSSVKCNENLPTVYSSVELINENNKYYLCFCVETPSAEKPLVVDKTIGIDLGLKTLISDSEGKKVKRFSLKLYNSYQKRIKQLNQSLATKTKGSERRKKVKKQLGKAHTRLTNIRQDFLHKASTKYIKENLNNRIVVGDIQVNSIIQNSYSMPNVTKRSKKGLRRNFYNAGLTNLKSMFKYKANKFGCNLEFVGEKNTSKTCSGCHHIKYDLKLSDRVFECNYCKTDIDRDVNAAINIRDVWLGQFVPIPIQIRTGKAPCIKMP